MKLNNLHIIAAICLVIGLAIFIAGFSMLGFDITRLSTDAPYEPKSFVSSGSVENISIDDNNADIELSPSADDKVHITYYENNKEYYDISESAQGDLVIKSRTSRKWYDYIFTFKFEQPKLHVEVPAHYDGDITVKSHDGHVLVKDISADDMLLTSFGDDIKVQYTVLSGRLEAKASDDSIYIEQTSVTGGIICHVSDGKLELSAVTGKTIQADNRDGDIALKTAAADDSIDLKTFDGDIRLDAAAFGQDLSCAVTDGSVTGTIAGRLSDYSITCKVIDGKSNLPESMTGGDNLIGIKVTDGDVRIDFIG